AGDRQDPARDRDHAGEPLVRFLFRNVPRCGRHPDAAWTPRRLRAGPAGPRLREPFHDPSLINAGGPHGELDAAREIDGGAMDGFAASALEGHHAYCATNPFSPDCTADTGRLGQPDA